MTWVDTPPYDDRVPNAIAQLPATFGIRDCPGRFRINLNLSCLRDGEVMLRLDMLSGNVWLPFCEATIAELTERLISLPRGESDAG